MFHDGQTLLVRLIYTIKIQRNFPFGSIKHVNYVLFLRRSDLIQFFFAHSVHVDEPPGICKAIWTLIKVHVSLLRYRLECGILDILKLECARFQNVLHGIFCSSLNAFIIFFQKSNFFFLFLTNILKTVDDRCTYQFGFMQIFTGTTATILCVILNGVLGHFVRSCTNVLFRTSTLCMIG